MATSTIEIRSFSEYLLEKDQSQVSHSDHQQLDNAVSRVQEGAHKFASLSIQERINLINQMQSGFMSIAQQCVERACHEKSITTGTPVEAEEWATNAWPIIRHLRLLRESLQQISQTGKTKLGKLDRNINDQLSVNVFPGNAIDGILFKDWNIDVHLQQGVTEETLDQRAVFYQNPDHDGRVCLVLGAGNIAALGPTDVFTKMFNEGKVCVLKMNPVNAYLGSFFEQAFSSAIDQGFLAIVYGGKEEGQYLINHAGIDEIHITGSNKSYEEIVWGVAGEERINGKNQNRPIMTKPITAELGNISPVIVVPGPYSDAELAYQAESLVSDWTMNASFFCCSGKLLITPAGWDKKQTFMSHVEDLLNKVPPRKAYYPGAEDRWAAFIQDHEAKHFGSPAKGELPWTMIHDLDPDNGNETIYHQEAFCSVMGNLSLGDLPSDNSDPVSFINKAVDFANEQLWGTLTATLVIHPKLMKDKIIGSEIRRAISRLRYGTVAINGFVGMSYSLCNSPWGAYPGSTLQDIQSGQGWVHNPAMLEGIEKVVMTAPLKQFPKPGYFISHKTTHKMTPKLVALDEQASWRKLPSVVMTAMKG